MPAVRDGGYRFEPIGHVVSPFRERAQAPRQGTAAREVEGRVELLPGHGYEHALEGVEDWEYLWLLFVFHRNVEQARGWRAKVQPPRSGTKRGVFATRSPHRPSPIGLTAVRRVRVEGLVVHVRGLDLLDGTPVLDIKPYVPYADAFPRAGSGWLEAPDPLPPWRVRLTERAAAQLRWLAERGADLSGRLESALSLGPTPGPYRRIRVTESGFELAIKEWRVDFAVDLRLPEEPGRPARGVVVAGVRSGHRDRDLAKPSLALHRAFMEAFR